MDIYSAAYYVFDILIKYDKLKNVIIVFDELINYPNFEKGEFKALKEMVDKYNLEYEIIGTHGGMLKINDLKIMKNLSFTQIRKKDIFKNLL